MAFRVPGHAPGFDKIACQFLVSANNMASVDDLAKKVYHMFDLRVRIAHIRTEETDLGDYRGDRGRSGARNHTARYAGQPAPNRRTSQPGRRQLPVWLLIVLDVFLIGLFLNAYALFHHVIPQAEEVVALPTLSRTSTPAPTASPAPTATPAESGTQAPETTGGAVAEQPPTPTPVPADLGMWGGVFAGKFTNGEVEKTENAYRSKDVNVTVTRESVGKIVYYFADIYIRNIDNFKTGLADDKAGVGYRETTLSLSKRKNAVVGMNGDNYGARREGFVVRNGEGIRAKEFRDVLVLYRDGTMKTFAKSAFQYDRDAADAWQMWSFGPMLLDASGQPMDSFDTDVARANPRSSIGYYEPGHYCFILVDGRGESPGMTMEELSQLFHDKGCKAAYNLDGGRTSVMTFMGELANDPYEGGRSTSDIVYIAETE